MTLHHWLLVERDSDAIDCRHRLHRLSCFIWQSIRGFFSQSTEWMCYWY